jgi:hypothetical protein
LHRRFGQVEQLEAPGGGAGLPADPQLRRSVGRARSASISRALSRTSSTRRDEAGGEDALDPCTVRPSGLWPAARAK